MTELEMAIVRQTKDLAEGKNQGHELLDSLLGVDRENITGQSAIRYLLQIKLWDLTPTSPFAPAMQHLFGQYDGKPRVEPEVYRAKTRDLIRDLWGFECIEAPLTPEVVRESSPHKSTTKKKAPAKKPAPRKVKEVPSRAGGQDISTDIDTTGASSRLKKVIAIQRGS